MTFRAIVQGGLIIVNTHGQIPDGTPVEILLPKGLRRAPSQRAPKTPANTPARRARGTRTPGFGMWADRSDLGPDSEAVDRPRALTRSRRVG